MINRQQDEDTGVLATILCFYQHVIPTGFVLCRPKLLIPPYCYEPIFHFPVSFSGVRFSLTLFYHDTELLGKMLLRNIKVTELAHRADETIAPCTVDAPTP